MVVDNLFNTLKLYERSILKDSKFVMFKYGEYMWKITVESAHGNPAFIIEQNDDKFLLKKRSGNSISTIFENLSAISLVHGVPFYLMNFWGQFHSEYNYEYISNDMSLEEATNSLHRSLKDLKYANFNISKGLKLKQVGDGKYAYEITINNEVKTETDTLDIVANTIYSLSRDLNDFYILFYMIGLEDKYEEKCKKFYMYDDLYRAPIINFYRGQRKCRT